MYASVLEAATSGESFGRGIVSLLLLLLVADLLDVDAINVFE
jgi:hypothetical protein